MSRQTYREPNGRWGVKGISWAEIPDGLYGALCKLRDYEDRCEHPYLIESLMDEGDFTGWTLVDKEHNVWRCNHCGRLHRFEADGPDENGFACCPYCGKFIENGSEDTDPEPTAAEYAELMESVGIEGVLKTAMLDGLYTTADCRLIPPEEYDRKYGEATEK